ncbi:MAG: putative adhesin [Bacteroidota bacterium]
MIVIGITFVFNSNSQGISNFWLHGFQGWFGRPGGTSILNFYNSSLDTSWQNQKMYFHGTIGQISDSAGNLLFTSNGQWIANAANDTMLNGTGLNPAFATTLADSFGLRINQANLVIPKPGVNKLYYLFHLTADYYPNYNGAKYLYYSLIDMNGDGGLGEVIQKNQIILSNDTIIPGLLTACKHANGRDWWIFAIGENDNRWIKYLLTPYGLDGPFFEYVGTIHTAGSLGQSVFSQDGTKLVKYEAWYGDLDIFNFDRCTGNISFLEHLDINDSSLFGGAAFSASGKTLYLSSTNYVYQFDMTATNIAASVQTVAVWDGYYSPNPPFATLFYLMHLMGDGKIYINCSNSTVDIHVINYPDSLGVACDVCQHCVALPSINNFTIPNYPNYFLGADTTSLVCDSLSSGMVNPEYNHLNLKAWPIPTTSGSSIMLTYHTLNDKGGIELYNTNGTLVKTYPLPPWSQTQTIKLPELAGGVYLLRLVSGERKGSVKIMVE